MKKLISFILVLLITGCVVTLGPVVPDQSGPQLGAGDGQAE